MTAFRCDPYPVCTTYQTVHDHCIVDDDGTRHWACSECPYLGPWHAGMEYFGSPECKRCGMSKIESVVCARCNHRRRLMRRRKKKYLSEVRGQR